MTQLRTGLAALALGLATVTAAHAAPPLVDSAWLQPRLDQSNLVVLDIRNKIDGGSREVFEAGHIPGAVYSNYLTDGWRIARDGVPGMLPETAALETLIGGLGIGNDSHVVIVPGGVSAVDYGSATRVYWTFKVLGHDEVSILDGGFAAWRQGNRPLASGPAEATPRDYRVTEIRRELLATAEDVEKALTTGTALIDNRPVEQFRGEAKHPKAARAGSLPGARNIPQSQFFDAETGRFASAETVAGLWRDQKVEAEGEQIAYCNTGHWASLGWFASYAVLGNEKARMYDGSMTDWSAEPARPMSTPN